MKTSNMSSENSFVKSMNRSMKRKKITLIVLLVLLAAIIVLCVTVGVRIRKNNRIAKAKSVITQLDIKSTYKEPEFDDDGDWDGDGLNNGREEEAKTDIQNEDTDGDGMNDGDEIAYGTDPSNPDTDGDGLLDGYEIIAGTNPRMTRTDGETDDAQRILTVEKSDGDCTVRLTGNANIADVTIEELDLFGIKSNPSVISGAYDTYCDYDFETAELTFKINESKMKKRGCSYKDLTVLKFDPSTLEYTKIDSTADKSKKTVSAKVTELGTYVVGVEETVNAPSVTRVCFLIDNSGSMYPKELCPTSSENDVDFKRLDFTQSLIDKFDKDYLVGICKFTGTYSKMLDFTDDRKALSNALESIKKEDEIFNGTYNQTALKKCIGEFKASGDGKYRNIIVMLSDGESDEENPEAAEQLTKLADEKSVIVLTVGLGRDIDRQWLQDIAYSTGGKYYSASDANALEDVYKQIVTTLNYDIVSYSDSDDEVSGYDLYNTGFEPSRNGFSFKNFRTTTTASVDFGMAVMARDWYMGNLQTSLGGIEPADESKLKVSAEGYDLSGTDAGTAYEERKNLSSVSTEIFSGKYANVKEYLDYDQEGGNLRVKKNYKYDAQNRGWEIAKTKIDAGNLSWHYVELLDLDIAGSLKKIEGGYNKSDAQLVSALYRLNVLQWDDSGDEFKLAGGDECFEKLEELLSLGVPVVTTIDDTHTVNTIGLIRDSECHRKYILRIYDNNYPGKVKELYIEKKPACTLEIDGDNVKVTDTGFTYSATYEGKQVGVSFSDVGTH
ncbi:MAG: VWA domain-containing protein [Ruminococcus sp.]|nr:VWA domain-containing protein [Ruminococcus sp.]